MSWENTGKAQDRSKKEQQGKRKMEKTEQVGGKEEGRAERTDLRSGRSRRSGAPLACPGRGMGQCSRCSLVLDRSKLYHGVTG